MTTAAPMTVHTVYLEGTVWHTCSRECADIVREDVAGDFPDMADRIAVERKTWPGVGTVWCDGCGRAVSA